MIKKNYKIKSIIALFALLLIYSIAFVFVNYTDFVSPVYTANKIDNIILGDMENQYFIDRKNERVNIIDEKQSDKKYNLIIPQTKNIYLGLIKDEKEKYLFNNQGNFNSGFGLKKKITDSSNLQVVYNSKQERLDFLMSGYELLISDNKINIKNNILYSLYKIAPNAIIKIGEDNIINISDNLNIETAIRGIEDTEIKIFKPINDNLLGTTTASFENGLWQTEAGDCSNKMDGASEIDLKESSDASDGKIAMELSSKNHYACTSKIFPVQMKEDKLYQLSFDYKNIAGKDVRYYYKLRSEENNKILGYAFTETIQAENNRWNTFSTIIKPKTVKENFVHPEYIEEDQDGFNADLFLGKGISDFYSGDPIDDIKFIDIFFYAPSDGSKEIVNLYDNVRLVEYELTETRKIDLESVIDTDIVLAENIFLQQGKNKFEYIVDDTNLLDAETASFESGLWQKEAGDCSNSKPGEPDLKLEESSDVSDGEKSAELSSKNHYACISKAFPVNLSDGKLYKLQFDYKNIKGGKVMYYYNLRSDEKQNTHSEMIKTEDNNWHTYETIIDPEISGVKYFNIHFYAPSDGKEEIINLYDNVRLTEYLPKDIDSYYLHAEQEVDETPKLKSVEYKAVNRWKNKVVLHGVKDSFLLVYPEKYSEKWKVYLTSVGTQNLASLRVPDDYFVPEIESNRQATREEVEGFVSGGLISAVGDKFISKNFDGSIRNDNLSNGRFYDSWFKEPIDEDIHFQVNNYSNAWWVDVEELCGSVGDSAERLHSPNGTMEPTELSVCVLNSDGTYEIELIIENGMLRWFYLGLLVFGVVLFGCLGYLEWDCRRMKKKKN